MSEQHERHGDAAAVFDCLKYHASAGGEYEYRGTMALEAFDRICTTLLDLKAQRDELLATLNKLRRDHATCEDNWYSCPKSGECLNKDDGDRCTCGADEHNAIIDAAIANAEKPPCD